MKFNKIFIVILLGVLLIPCKSIYAKTITVDDVVNEISKMIQNDENDNSIIYKQGNKIVYNYEKKLLEELSSDVEFNVDGDVIYWNFPGDKENEEDLKKYGMGQQVLQLIYAICNLRGLEHTSLISYILDNGYENITFEDNGLEIKTFVRDHGELIAGEFIESFKIDVNKFNLDFLKNYVPNDEEDDDSTDINEYDNKIMLPEDITINDIIEKLKTYDIYKDFYNEHVGASVGIFRYNDSATIQVNYNNTNYEVAFQLLDHVLYMPYQKFDDWHYLDDINSGWIINIIRAIIELEGIEIKDSNITDIKKAVLVTGINIPNYKYDESGIEFKYKLLMDEDYYVDSFKINLLDFDIDKFSYITRYDLNIISDNDSNNSNYNNGETGTTNNPNTGIISIAISSIIFAIISFIALFIIKKKNYFKFNS